MNRKIDSVRKNLFEPQFLLQSKDIENFNLQKHNKISLSGRKRAGKMDLSLQNCWGREQGTGLFQPARQPIEKEREKSFNLYISEFDQFQSESFNF